MHVVGLSQTPRASSRLPKSCKIELSEAGFGRLIDRLDAGFARAGEPPLPQPLGPGLYGPSLFYRAVEPFHIFNVCNHWVGYLLSAAGLPIAAGARDPAAGIVSRSEMAIGTGTVAAAGSLKSNPCPIRTIVPGGPHLIVTAKTANKVQFFDAGDVGQDRRDRHAGLDPRDGAVARRQRRCSPRSMAAAFSARTPIRTAASRVIDLRSKSLERMIDVGDDVAPHSVMMDEGGTLWATAELANAALAIDPDSGAVAARRHRACRALARGQPCDRQGVRVLQDLGFRGRHRPQQPQGYRPRRHPAIWRRGSRYRRTARRCSSARIRPRNCM